MSDPGREIPRRIAVALRYRRGFDAVPTVTAAGRGLMADRIVALAHEGKVPVHEDAELAEALDRVGLDHGIPPELFGAVAEVIAFVHRLRPGRAA